MTPEYFAGFFDGEGCVDIAKSRRGREYQLRVTISNTILGPLSLINHLYGGSIYEHTPKKETHKKLYQWSAVAIDAYTFLCDIAPYCMVKKDQIELALDFYALLITQGYHGPHKMLTDSEISAREKFYVALKQLKVGGLARGES